MRIGEQRRDFNCLQLSPSLCPVLSDLSTSQQQNNDDNNNNNNNNKRKVLNGRLQDNVSENQRREPALMYCVRYGILQK